MEAYAGPRQLPFFVGRYCCEHYLGGGMADVYRARDTELPREVAIKILKPESQNEEAVREAFRDEAQLAAQCHHDNIVTIHDRGEFEGHPFIVMEFLRGDGLDAVIKSGVTRDIGSALKIARQISAAMECVHGQNIVHRDLKPQNLHMDKQGRVKLVDFGIAKSVAWNKTAEGMIKGTAPYMAPEYVAGQPISLQTDIWAFGVVLFEMLTGGTRPFENKDLNLLFIAIANASPDYQVLVAAGVPNEIQGIVKRCLEKDPGQRYQNFAEASQAIDRAAQSLAAPAPTETQTGMHRDEPVSKPTSYGLWIGLGVAVVLVGLIAGACYLWLIPKPAGTVVEVEFKDMVRVPKGKALLGKDKHQVYVAEFYIDRTEVSNRAYAKFLSANPQHPRPHDFEENDNPVVGVSFYDAQEFAKWAHKRLPTEEEWEKAARGTDGRVYPWGNEEDPGKANLNSTGVTSVDSFPNGASRYGALNMCGNVWEWVNTTTQPTPEILTKMQAKDPSIKNSDIFYMLKGWSYRQRWTPSLLWDHSEHRPDYHAASIGFRCARTPSP